MNEMKYRIGEFAKEMNISSYTLRYYENEKLIIPHRDTNDHRFYTTDDAKWLEFLLHLKSTGMTMAEIKTYIQLRSQGDQTMKERQELLEKVQTRAQEQIESMQQSLIIVNHKIDWYRDKINQNISEDESFEAYLKNFSL
ncbi:MerR family transcriptional regulator [Companilactobacillus sp. DQM5]|uniref:MerR family transcriptional regulator n=1 Tax=Companilactobacillus sp. DQM5 TaxID=3463359 RepID=UPI00405886F2